MPYAIRKVGKYYQVYNKDTHHITAKHSTLANAQAQTKLLRAIEHGFKPKKRKVKFI